MNKILDNSNETILIIVAHTDDETLAMGGTIAKHINLLIKFLLYQ